jgi:hypothetical protein
MDFGGNFVTGISSSCSHSFSDEVVALDAVRSMAEKMVT